MINPTKSVLFKTSAATDVKRVGGTIDILGLESISEKNITKINQFKYRAEVVKVETITTTPATYAPQASTDYIVQITDTTTRRQGVSNATAPKEYKYTTPATLTDIGATAALQNEAINVGLIAKINEDTPNNVVAVTLGSGNGFTITDDADYYPAKTANGQSPRQGKTTIRLVKDENGRGFSDSAQRAVTTDATYAFGVGARLLANAPVISAYFGGNLIAGFWDTPLTTDNPPQAAVSGQQYDAFCIESLTVNSIATIGDERGLRVQRQWVFVDNGLGTVTTNRAGFIAFETQMHKLIFDNLYGSDPKTVIEFFDEPFLAQDDLGAAPGTTGQNKFVTPYGALVYNQIGTQTIVSGVLNDLGYILDQDLEDTEGAAYTPALTALNDKKFTVGKYDFAVIAKVVATDWTDTYLKIGFRKKAAHTADFNDYTDLAGVGTDSTGDDFVTFGILNNAATVITDTTVNAVDAVASEFRVHVDKGGVVSCYIDNVKYPVYSVGTTPLVLDAGDEMIPFFEHTNISTGDPTVVISEFVAVADAYWKIDN